MRRALFLLEAVGRELVERYGLKHGRTATLAAISDSLCMNPDMQL